MIILNEGNEFLSLYMAANILRIYAVSRYMKSFFGSIVRPAAWAGMVYLIYFLMNSFGFILFRRLSVNILSNFLCCLLVSCMYCGGLDKKLLATVLINAINIGWDSLIGAAFLPTQRLLITTGSLTGICVLITWYAVDRYMALDDLSSENLPGSGKIILTIPIATIGLAALNYYFNFDDPLTVMNLIGLLFIDIMAFRIYEYLIRLYRDWYSEKLFNEQNMAHQYQYNVLQESIVRMQRLRHDMKGHVQSLAAILEDGRTQDAMSYLHEMHDFVKPEEEFVATGNRDVDSTLNYKLSRALESAIYVKTLVSVPSNLPIKAFDLNVVLSNLIDNAIEAAEKCEEKRIEIVMRAEMNMLYIAVENTYRDEPVRSRNRFMTWKEDKGSHGFGIQNVRDVVKKYGGEISFHYEEGIFRVTLFLPVADRQF